MKQIEEYKICITVKSTSTPSRLQIGEHNIPCLSRISYRVIKHNDGKTMTKIILLIRETRWKMKLGKTYLITCITY